MATNPSLLPEIGPDGLAREAPVIALTEKIIEEEQLQLKRYIEENYSKIRDVERELASLSMEMKLTAGPKKAALELLRKKIEAATERIRAAKLKEDQARKVWEDASKVVQDEEAKKQKLCDDLNRLVQESTTSQYTRLEELKRRLEALNPSRVSTLSVPAGESGKPVQQEGNTTAPSPPALPQTVELAGRVPDNAQNAGNNDNASGANGNNQSQAIEIEGRGKRRANPGRGRGNIVLPKARGSQGSGWTGAGFDVDGRS